MSGKCSRRGWLARQCDVCRHKAFRCYALVFGASRVCNGHAPGSVVLDVEAGAVLCGRCVAASGLELKVKELPVATKRKRCHRCGGAGRIRSDIPNGRWVPHRRGVASAGTSIASSSDTLVRCPKCHGAGEVPA